MMRKATYGFIFGGILSLMLSKAPLQAGMEERAGDCLRRWPAGVRAELGYTGDGFFPASGGLSRQSVYLDNLDLMVDLDLEALLNARKTTVRVHVQSNRGRSISERVGDAQGVSNIEAPSEWRLYEAWIEHNLLPGRLSILVGVYDMNAEFDVIPVAGDFLNSSFGFGPEYSMSGINGPSTFPLTTLGARITVRPFRRFYARMAVTDGSPGDPGDPGRSRFALKEGALISLETGYFKAADGLVAIFDEPPSRVQGGNRRIGRDRTTKRMRQKLSLGGWMYTRTFETWGDGGARGRNWGLYALGEQLLWAGTGGEPGLSLFARAGTANDEVNRWGLYFGGGVVCSGPIPGRASDVAGLGVAHARNGSPFLASQSSAGGPLDRAETVVELSYRFQLSDLFHIQPNLQWVIHPGTDPDTENALVFGLRGMITAEIP